ncbi:unnamed protein product [Linum trigynum]|uniref:Uncharacterized protein n=1 Tax=Linum trigynum TaxID=586398 RepID=A0AAV2G2Y6_9ROSI
MRMNSFVKDHSDVMSELIMRKQFKYLTVKVQSFINVFQVPIFKVSKTQTIQDKEKDRKDKNHYINFKAFKLIATFSSSQHSSTNTPPPSIVAEVCDSRTGSPAAARSVRRSSITKSN